MTCWSRLSSSPYAGGLEGVLWFPQVFEAEGGLASGEVMLHLVVATFFKCIAEIRIILYPAVQMTNGCSAR